MPQRNVVTWTAMITSNNSRNNHMRAWSVFPQMLRDGVKALSCGQLVHSLAIKIGVQGSSVYVDNSLMDMYATCCDSMDRARMVFDDITTKTDVCWTTLITGYTHRGDAYGGLRVFRQMFLEEGALSLFSFSIAARACASIGSGILGKQVHAEVVKHGFESNLPVMNSILDMYCKCHCESEAKRLFSVMTHKDTITWNTLIAGFEALDSRESLCIFSRMVSEGLVQIASHLLVQ
ncbi:hypothetical protein AAZX31_20G085100 [Glycine max]|uniref:Putative pentatricopeptide repeat-containing protein n=1 Tax=Glycine soja TaxID=3848 RepID=A0A0B2P544_GLYSO|nr:hypothetical protein GLYMA_20G095366v4 [Glycine max]KAG4909937.1 hypothetical protein JHK87_056053 [Glycine soja]KAG4918518.1 hypothetical protein JHK85_056799 [Glycine max]KAG5074595.1 hypothetical protein JHK84_055826 [Glycine max]KAG5077264.1 hypothetical protein JHK82_055959 [Glycine max]